MQQPDGDGPVDHVARHHGEPDTRPVEVRTHCVERGFAGPLARGHGGVSLGHRLVREEVRLVAGDEDDPSADRHQRYGQERQPLLRVTVEPHRVTGVGAVLEPSGRVEDQRVQPAEARPDGVDQRGGVGFDREVRRERRGVAARVADGLGDHLRPLCPRAVVDDDVGVRPGELSRDLGSDAPRSAGHEDDSFR